LSDSDNSLFIFSMRWAGVLFDALAAVLAFVMLLLITRNTILSFGICLLYYILNIQTLAIDLIRIDHYMLFAAMSAMCTALLVLYYPTQKKYYVLCGIGAGLVTATKINFPFHLFIVAIVLGYLLVRKQLGWRHFLIFCLALGTTFIFAYQRWFMYSENIARTIKDTIHVGEDWFAFWGNDNYTYYLGNQFFVHGSSFGVTLFLVLFYTSVVYCVFRAFAARDYIKGILALTFILQTISLMFSPKIGRYAIMMPFWASIFAGIGLSALINLFTRKVAATIASLFLVLPVFAYNLHDFFKAAENAKERAISIQKTRIEPYKWIQQNIPAGSVMAIQHPRLSNPPIFEMPYQFTTKFFQFPFLYKDSLLKFYPDSIELQKSVNYIITSDKETNYHLSVLVEDSASSSLIACWNNFYASLNNRFSNQCFSSDFANYGVKSICIYKVNDSMINQRYTEIYASDSVVNHQPILLWTCRPVKGVWAGSFQIQIATDSSMQWLVYGSRDGYYSRYRAINNPVILTKNGISYIPEKIKRALDAGAFNKMLDISNTKGIDDDFNILFAHVLFTMNHNSLNFGESIGQITDNINPEFLDYVAALYKSEGDIIHSTLHDYLKISALNLNFEDVSSTELDKWKFALPLNLQRDKRYYWRVRINNHSQVLSKWSKVQTFTL
jgi:hypothetical protein